MRDLKVISLQQMALSGQQPKATSNIAAKLHN
jgi:hypothetical protein